MTKHNVGYRIITQISRPDPALLSLYADVESTQVSDAMYRFYGMDGNIRPVSPEMRAVGPALTVRTRPGDNLIVFKAMEIAQPGDVLVIEYRQFTAVAGWGDLTSMVAKKQGIAGIVIDGSIRDAAGIRRVGVPVFAQDVYATQGGLKDGPGEINVPISCGGVPVLPGDLVVADLNGVVIVPQAAIEEVGHKTQAVAAAERQKIADIEAGKLFPPDLDETLRSKGATIE